MVARFLGGWVCKGGPIVRIGTSVRVDPPAAMLVHVNRRRRRLQNVHAAFAHRSGPRLASD
jgi:hypothetical protein